MPPTLSAAAACRRDASAIEKMIVDRARRLGVGWEHIGAAVGASGDQARERYGEPEED